MKIYFVKLQYNELKKYLEKNKFKTIKKIQVDIYVVVSFWYFSQFLIFSNILKFLHMKYNYNTLL